MFFLILINFILKLNVFCIICVIVLVGILLLIRCDKILLLWLIKFKLSNVLIFLIGVKLLGKKIFWLCFNFVFIVLINDICCDLFFKLCNCMLFF